jgi:hypothetical protein
MKVWLLLLMSVIVLFPRSLTAGDQEPLHRLLEAYAELKQRVLEVRETRKAGYASDSGSLMVLFSDISEAKQDAFQFRADQHISGVMSKTDETTSSMIYAYEAMSQIVSAEVDRNLYLLHSDAGLRIAEKYEELWKMIDSSIPAVSVTS